MSARLTCEEAIAMLVDYLESTLDEATTTLLDAHLAECEPCRAYLATYRRTIGVVGKSERVEMPLELRSRLTAFLVERLRAKM
jgi:predicted anti-sigma-YlaC factor YlaD